MSETLHTLIRAASASPVAHLRGLRGAVPLFAADLCRERGAFVCLVVPEEEQLDVLRRDVELFTNAPILLYPSFEIPPYSPLSPDQATVAARIATLYRLRQADGPGIVIVSAEALLRRVLPWAVLDRHCELVMSGEQCDPDLLLAFLVRAGYESRAMVRSEGDFSVRGGIIDIFPPAMDGRQPLPLRLDFFGEVIESIRVFDPVSQRSIEELDEAVLTPASDVLFGENQAVLEGRARRLADAQGWSGPERNRVLERIAARDRFPGIEFLLPLIYAEPEPMASVLDYLPADASVLLLDPPSLRQRINLISERIAANHDDVRGRDLPVMPPSALFLDQEEIDRALAGRRVALLHDLPDPELRDELVIRGGNHALLRQEIELQRKRRGLLAPLADRLKEWIEAGDRIYLCCRSGRQAGHLAEMLAGYQLAAEPSVLPILSGGEDGRGLIRLVEHPLSRGFELPDEGLHVLSATELFGEKRLPGDTRAKQPREAEAIRVEELNDGDLVVHREHGIGLFKGLVNMEVNGLHTDLMSIAYRDGDLLYVPVDRLHWVSRYQGLADSEPRLDRLGSSTWQGTKKKVTDAVWKVAQELLDIYARRAMEQGHQYSRGGELFRELEESFPYDETRDQLKAINEVLDDLAGERPMDRLVCGDVGYGKTEVAVRAAFKVIEEGQQVALLVPTTVLAEQHVATFRERFAGFPVDLACINRFRTTREQNDILRGLASGGIDFVVGTHRLLSKDVAFKRLGLLIVDEEHRFGVGHKEKIKKLRAQVDVLTLTATPIPRTLQMSLLGIRDLSVISSPPRMRRAVKTFVSRYEPLVIREAMSRELGRGGQVFFVHNRVQSINRMAAEIQELAPEARVAVAHGQMPGPQLEEIMVEFINHRVDVLVCTTIIESGLDIPNANTIIINRADRLGLADVYQLRGRVGRSSRQSYAYLLVPDLDALTRDARERLHALMDASELGAGFKLAMNDLQIRGGGNLLGVSQSGHIAAVGYDLYLELLQNTVADLKARAGGEEGEVPPQRREPEINLGMEAYIPDTYIADTAQRYHMYRRINLAAMGEPVELEDLRDEIADRYGPPPGQTNNLLAVAALKRPLAELGVLRLEQGPVAVVLTFAASTPVRPETILALVEASRKKKGEGWRLTPDSRLVAPLAGSDPETVFTTIRHLLTSLAQQPSPLV